MSDRTERLREQWRRTAKVLRAPRIVIEAYGGREAREAYLTFTSRHPRFRLTALKRWGVALIRVPASYDDYLAGHSKWVLRQRLRLATRHNFRYSVVTPQDYLDDILVVNRSAPSRQGRAMPASYVDPERLSRAFEGQTTMHGVFNGDGRLRAYATVLAVGDACVFTHILGHADDLELGTMYLLVSEVVRSCIARRSAHGSPVWLMYDTYWGASRGLTFFKDRLGFEPYTVEWRWVDRGSG
jgi:hypothetical protein